MPDLGDLTNLFKTHVPNLDWLDVDEDVYRELEKLPKQNLDIVPDLVDMWSTHDKGPVYYVPNVELSTYPEVRPEPKVSTQQMVALVAQKVKDKMMSGWNGDRLTSWIRDHVEPNLIQACIPTLTKLANEQGVLGVVYIDATSWDKCGQGQGEDIARKAKHAKYVLGNESKCSKCVFNESGKCSKFRKELVFDVVPYTDEMVNEYASVFKVSPTASAGNPKDRIRALVASTWAEPEPVVAQNMPTMGPQEKRVSPTRTYEPPSTQFVNAAERSLYRDLSQKMMVTNGHLSDNVRARLSSAGAGEALTALRGEENLLGPVYVRPDQFDSCHQANASFRKHQNRAAYILEIPGKCERCSFHRAGSCSLMGKQVVKEVPYTKDFLANEISALVDAGKVPQEVANGLLARADSDSIHDLVREARTYKQTTTRVYSGRQDLVDMGSATAGRPLVAVEGAIPHKHRPVVMATYRAVYDGLEGDRLKGEIVGRFGADVVKASANHIAPVVAMGGLLGNVVLDLRGFKSASEARSYLASKGYHPKFLLREGCCAGCPEMGHNAECPSRQFPNMTVLPEDGLDMIPADYVSSSIDKLERKGTLTASTATSLRNKIGETSGPDILRIAFRMKPAPTQHPYREVRQASRLPEEKVVAELQRLSQVRQKKETEAKLAAIEAAYTAGSLSSVARQAFVDNVGHFSMQDILAKIETYKMAQLKPASFASTDVSTQIDGMGKTVATASAGPTDTERRSLRNRILRAMNRGLHGDPLKNFIRNSFSMDLLRAEKTRVASLISNQGLVGGHYIDPTPYKACQDGARETADSAAVYVAEMKRCQGCIHRNANSRCAVYGRTVVADVPYPDGRDEMQDNILNPVAVTRESIPSVNVNPVLEYGVSVVGMEIEMDAQATKEALEVDYEDPMGDLG